MFGFQLRRKRSVPYGMFDWQSHGLAAKNARVLERVYHKGNKLTWDGKEVLGALIEEHGLPQLDRQTKKALGRVFSIIMWGELAAWRISAELADEIEPLEAKMAATSQAFDEARHFYVMHDYLVAADALPERLDRGPQRLLEAVMNANHLSKKLLGMQLMVEPIALTLFHVVRKLGIEPVLSGLLPYYERDEARHVALGVQYLPAMLSQMSRRERLGLWAFQFKLLTYEMMSQRAVAKDMQILGFDGRELLRIGKGKQLKAMNMVFESLDMEPDLAATMVGRYADFLSELLIVDMHEDPTLGQRLSRAWSAATGYDASREVEIAPDVGDDQTPLIRGLAS